MKRRATASTQVRLQLPVPVILSEGAQQISVLFSADEVLQLGVNGLYTISDALLTYHGEPEASVADFRQSVGMTGAYTLLSLNRPSLFFTGRRTENGEGDAS